MAGVTTAARLGVGSIASSEAMNPKAMGGFLASGDGSGNYWISSIPTSDFHDLEIWIKSSQQSTWITSWNLTFATAGNVSVSNSQFQSYLYKGYSTGQSNGTNAGAPMYNYPSGFSNYGHYYRIYLSNYSSTSNIKSWHGYGGYTNGSATSYVTYQQGGGTIRSAAPITDLYVSNGYANGSPSYQGWSIFGRRPK
jgi:hypothetical protein